MAVDGADLGFRREAYGRSAAAASSGDRRLEIVRGKDFSAAASYDHYYYSSAGRPAARSRSPEPPPQRHLSRGGGGRGGLSSSAWCFRDPESKRRRRVASYKAYAVEGKVKASLRKGFRWIKIKCSDLVHGW